MDEPNEVIELTNGYDIAIYDGFSVHIRKDGDWIARPIERCRSRNDCIIWARLYFRDRGAELAAMSTLMYSLSNHL